MNIYSVSVHCYIAFYADIMIVWDTLKYSTCRIYYIFVCSLLSTTSIYDVPACLPA